MPIKLITKKFFIWPFLALLIIVRYILTLPAYHDGDRVRISSAVVSDPIKYANSQSVKIAGLKVYLPLFPEISYGDYITIEGTVDAGIVKNPKLIKIENKKVFLSDFRNKLVEVFEKSLPEPEAGLLAGILIGSKGALLKGFYDQTKNVGVAHVVVASGTNITFVVSFLVGTSTIFLTRRKSIYIVILGIIMYLFISGFDAPLVRAAIMSSFLFLGQETGRLVTTWRIFFLTVFIMLFYNPAWITDIGFILSFASTAGLMLFEKRIRFKLKKVPEIFKESLSTSLAAQITVAPVIFITFGQFNILSPIVNALVLWTVPIVMIIGAAGGILGLIFLPLGNLVLWLAYPFLWWFTEVVSIFNF